jgi:hypothetical protein
VLHTYENPYGQLAEGSERWMLINLAEFLRENPTASALLVAREEKPYEPPETDEAATEDATPTGFGAQESPAEAAEESPEVAEEAEALTTFEVAEKFRNLLASEHGISPNRLVVKQGREVEVPGGRINFWVVPEKGPRPDPSALDPDEIEAEQQRLREANNKEGEPPPPAPR